MRSTSCKVLHVCWVELSPVLILAWKIPFEECEDWEQVRPKDDFILPNSANILKCTILLMLVLGG